MGESSSLSFNNFLMTKKLDELLELVLKEKDEHKIKYIKRAIYLKTNYVDDNNKKLEGRSLVKHKKNIKRKYNNTKYSEYIILNKSGNKGKILLGGLVLAIGLSIGYIYQDKIPFINNSTLKVEEMAKMNMIEDIRFDAVTQKFYYKDVELTGKKLKSLMEVKVYLGDKFLKEGVLEKATSYYLEAKEMAEILIEKQELDAILKKLEEIRLRINPYLDNKIELLGNNINISEEELKEEALAIIKLADKFGINIRDKVYEAQGDIYFNKFSLVQAKNYYLLANKFGNKKLKIEERIKNIEILIEINSILQEIKILQLERQTKLINKKYEKIIELNKKLDGNYKTLSLD